jgi:hypothetical protein
VSRFGAWAALALLTVLALALGLAVKGDTQTSVVPTVTNTGPRGLKVLHTWLLESGVDVRVGRGALTDVPSEIATIVVPAPQAAPLTEDEVQALRNALERGTTVVLMVARGTSMHSLNGLVSLRPGPTPELLSVPNDGAGSTLTVSTPVGALKGARTVRLSNDRSIMVTNLEAVALTSPPAIWAMQVGAGELYVAAGADLAENARLDLADNAVFWRNLAARGPIWIDESHHAARPQMTPTVNLWATGLQFLFAAALFVAARGSRLGPPRAEPGAALRSSTEYVEAMARLTLRARVEPELVDALRRDVRLTLHERLGLSLELPDEERARALTLTLGWTDADASGIFRENTFLGLSKYVARLEAQLDGRTNG